MSYSAAILIFAVCSVLAIVVAAPLIYLVRRKRKRSGTQSEQPTSKSLSLAQALPGLLLVVFMFLVFAHQFIAPDSWLGSKVTTQEGRLWFSLLVVLIVMVLSHLWRTFKHCRSKLKAE